MDKCPFDKHACDDECRFYNGEYEECKLETCFDEVHEIVELLKEMGGGN